MKLFALLLLSLLLLSSCSQGPTTKTRLQFSLGYQTLLTVGKARVLPVRVGSSSPYSVIDLNLGNPVITLPTGSWNFYTIEWTGAAPYTGFLRCGVSSTLDLKAGTETVVDITPSESLCGLPLFKAQFDNYCYESSTASGTGAGIFREGDGTTTAPYVVCSIAQLNSIAGSFPSSHFRLGRNLGFYGRFPTTASPNLPNEPAPFTMIQSLTGSFDGAGHSLSGLSITASETLAQVGLIRSLQGTVKNLYLYIPEIEASDSASLTQVGMIAGASSNTLIENVHVFYAHLEGYSDVGGLVGQASTTTITNSSYEGGEVAGALSLGGLVGSGGSLTVTHSHTSGELHNNSNSNSGMMGGLIGNLSSGTSLIQKSSSSTDIEGDNKIGGLIGNSSSTSLIVEDSYATGNLYAYGSSSSIGGIIGYASTPANLSFVFHTLGGIGGPNAIERGAIKGYGPTTTCTFSLETSSPSLTSSCSGATTATYSEMRNSLSYGSSWTSSGAWVFDDDTYDFPRLAWEKSRPCHGRFSGSFAGGSGTAADPYLICSREQFMSIADNFSGHYALLSNIDLISDVSSADAVLKDASAPSTPFMGSLNGNFHTISNMGAQGTNDDVGLFNSIGTSGSIKNLKFHNFKVNFATSGLSRAGVVAGTNAGLITKVSVAKGTITATSNFTGGIVGINNGVITLSESQAEIVGGPYSGGLAGKNNAIMSRSRSYSSITATLGSSATITAVGGIAGHNVGTISECETSSYLFFNSITASASQIGGFVGLNSGSIYDSFAHGHIDSASNDLENTGGFVGENLGQLNRVWSATTLTRTTATATVEPFIGFNNSTQSIFTDSFVFNDSSLGNYSLDTTGVTPLLSSNITLSDFSSAGWSIVDDKDILDEEGSPYIWAMHETANPPSLFHTHYDREGRTYLFYKNLLGF